jgi:putative transposase
MEREAPKANGDLGGGSAGASPSRGSPSRRHPVHGLALIEGQPTIVFDTVCTKDRRRWLARHEAHALLVDVWRESRAWMVGRYVIMPDHIHYFAGCADTNIEFDRWVTYWKSQFTKQLKKRGLAELDRVKGSAGASPSRASPSQMVHLWQTDHWDTRVRSHVHYEEKWLYVVENPVRQGLVIRAEDWPFQGEVFQLPWR